MTYEYRDGYEDTLRDVLTGTMPGSLWYEDRNGQIGEEVCPHGVLISYCNPCLNEMVRALDRELELSGWTTRGYWCPSCNASHGVDMPEFEEHRRFHREWIKEGIRK